MAVVCFASALTKCVYRYDIFTLCKIWYAFGKVQYVSARPRKHSAKNETSIAIQSKREAHAVVRLVYRTSWEARAMWFEFTHVTMFDAIFQALYRFYMPIGYLRTYYPM